MNNFFARHRGHTAVTEPPTVWYDMESDMEVVEVVEVVQVVAAQADFPPPTLRYDGAAIVVAQVGVVVEALASAQAMAAVEVGESVEALAANKALADYEPPREVSAIDESHWIGPIPIDSSDEDNGVVHRANRHVEHDRANHLHQIPRPKRLRRWRNSSTASEAAASSHSGSLMVEIEATVAGHHGRTSAAERPL